MEGKRGWLKQKTQGQDKQNSEKGQKKKEDWLNQNQREKEK